MIRKAKIYGVAREDGKGGRVLVANGIDHYQNPSDNT